MKLESLLNMWHLTQKDIEIVEHLRAPFMEGKEFNIEYSKDSDRWWQSPLKSFSYDISNKNFINSFKSPFISSRDHIEISIYSKSKKLLHQETINNQNIDDTISEICNQFKSQKKFTLRLKLIKPFEFDYFYSAAQIASILYMFINDFDFISDELRQSIFSQIFDEEITDNSILEFSLQILRSLESSNKKNELDLFSSFLTQKDVGIMIKYLDSISK